MSFIYISLLLPFIHLSVSCHRFALFFTNIPSLFFLHLLFPIIPLNLLSSLQLQTFLLPTFVSPYYFSVLLPLLKQVVAHILLVVDPLLSTILHAARISICLSPQLILFVFLYELPTCHLHTLIFFFFTFFHLSSLQLQTYLLFTFP